MKTLLGPITFEAKIHFMIKETGQIGAATYSIKAVEVPKEKPVKALVPKPPMLTCSVCGEEAGRWNQHPNRDTGYGVCSDCLTMMVISFDYSDAMVLSYYGVRMINYGLTEQDSERVYEHRALRGQHRNENVEKTEKES